MRITRQSYVSGIIRTWDIAITPEQYERWKHGERIAEVVPGITNRERIFIETGTTQEDLDSQPGEKEVPDEAT